jgi:hypothetical protein
MVTQRVKERTNTSSAIARVWSARSAAVKQPPDLDAWRWFVAATLTIGAFVFVAVLRRR